MTIIVSRNLTAVWEIVGSYMLTEASRASRRLPVMVCSPPQYFVEDIFEHSFLDNVIFLRILICGQYQVDYISGFPPGEFIILRFVPIELCSLSTDYASKKHACGLFVLFSLQSVISSVLVSIHVAFVL